MTSPALFWMLLALLVLAERLEAITGHVNQRLDEGFARPTKPLPA
jgi:hypothetical protein